MNTWLPTDWEGAFSLGDFTRALFASPQVGISTLRPVCIAAVLLLRRDVREATPHEQSLSHGWLTASKNTSPTSQGGLLVLADFANDGGKAWPSVSITASRRHGSGTVSGTEGR